MEPARHRVNQRPIKLMRLTSTALVFLCSFIASSAEIPSGIPQKAHQAAQFALHWSMDRILVRVEVKVKTDSSGKIWRNQTTYRFAFYSPSKQKAIWSNEAGNMDSSMFTIPADWSSESIPADFDDLPAALNKTRSENISAITSATLYYRKGKPQWLLELADGYSVEMHPDESVESVLHQ